MKVSSNNRKVSIILVRSAVFVVLAYWVACLLAYLLLSYIPFYKQSIPTSQNHTLAIPFISTDYTQSTSNLWYTCPGRVGLFYAVSIILLRTEVFVVLAYWVREVSIELDKNNINANTTTINFGQIWVNQGYNNSSPGWYYLINFLLNIQYSVRNPGPVILPDPLPSIMYRAQLREDQQHLLLPPALDSIY